LPHALQLSMCVAFRGSVKTPAVAGLCSVSAFAYLQSRSTR
jgi:hypothetical protein